MRACRRVHRAQLWVQLRVEQHVEPPVSRPGRAANEEFGGAARQDIWVGPDADSGLRQHGHPAGHLGAKQRGGRPRAELDGGGQLGEEQRAAARSGGSEHQRHRGG